MLPIKIYMHMGDFPITYAIFRVGYQSHRIHLALEIHPIPIFTPIIPSTASNDLTRPTLTQYQKYV